MTEKAILRKFRMVSSFSVFLALIFSIVLYNISNQVFNVPLLVVMFLSTLIYGIAIFIPSQEVVHVSIVFLCASFLMLVIKYSFEYGIENWLVLVLFATLLFYNLPKRGFKIYAEGRKVTIEFENLKMNLFFTFFSFLFGLYYIKEQIWVTYAIIILSILIFLGSWFKSESEVQTNKAH
jgi:hypothetical protein